MSNHPHLRPTNAVPPNGQQQPAPIAFIDAFNVELNRNETPAGPRVQITINTPIGFIRCQLDPLSAGAVAEKLAMLAKGILPAG